MYVKSISLYGFKTFANKLDFHFKPGVTAIVGPNGSGKSNLIDAIVWVMGEQSVRSIRGRKMEEVIFHGGANKKPLGYAQVVITFDNEDGFFPLPHSEVSIMRRYYKSGESEFAINREPCRLKDIQALIMDTGMGKMNYSIISQGDVEYIIDLSPNQRREIFDEAAGINRYKVEKEKTLKKVRETDSNIARLRDILCEIEETLEPLRIQSEKAHRYEELTEEIEKLKLSVVISEIVRLLGRMEELGGEEKLVVESNAAAVVAIKEIEEKLVDLIRRSDSRRRVVDEKLENLALVGGQLGRVEESIRRVELSIEQLDGNAAELEKRREKTVRRMEELSSLRNESKKELADKRNELEAAEADRRGYDGSGGDSLQEKQSKLAEECNAIRDRLQTLRSEENRLRNEGQMLGSRKAARSKELANMENRRASAGSGTSGLREKIEGLEKEHSKSSGELETARKEKTGIDSELPDLNKKYNSEKENSIALNDQVRELTARISALESVAASVKALYSKVAGSGTSGFPALADSIEIPEEFRKAAYRVLGSMLKAGVASLADARGKKLSAPDRASYYVISDWFEKNEPPKLSGILSGKNVKGALDSFITSKTGNTAILNAFRRVVVVEDEKQLLDILEKIPVGAAAVTMDGNYVFMEGILQAGEDLVTPDAISGRLDAAKGDLAERKSQSEKASASYEAVRKDFQGKTSRSDQLVSIISRLESAVHNALERKKSYEEQLGIYDREMKGIEEALSGIRPELAEIEAALTKQSADLENATGARKTEEQALNAKEPEYRAVTEDLRRIRAEREGLENRVAELRKLIDTLGTKHTQYELEYNQLKSRQDDLKANLDVLKGQREKQQEDLAQGRKEQDEWEAKKNGVQWEINEIRGEITKTSDNIKQLTRDSEAKKEALATGKEEIMKIEVKKARTDAQLEEARKQFEEEFPGFPEERAIAETPPVASGEKGAFRQLKAERESLMPVNQLAIGEYEEKKARYDVLMSQITDLEDARSTLMDMVEKYDDKSRVEFMETFVAVQEKFTETFIEVFGGGDAKLVLTDEDNPLEAGVEIKVMVPGQRMRNIGLLSGGQKAMCAMTLIFAILKVKPSPFYLMDEVDAGLDDVNVGRFKILLRRYSVDSQFFLITHNKGTISGADHFYGISIEPGEGYSKVISVSVE